MKNWPRTSGVGVIKTGEEALVVGEKEGGGGMKNNWGRVKVISRYVIKPFRHSIIFLQLCVKLGST